MEYRKNLIILSGDRGKGALTVETTARGSVCRLSVRAKGAERLYLAIKDGDKKFVDRLGDCPTELPFTPTRNAHYIIINATTRQPVLYGTLAEKRLWHANMTDGVLKDVLEKEYDGAQTDTVEKNDVDCAQTQNRTVETVYDDEAIALNDYYPKGYGEIGQLNTVYRNNKPGDRMSFSAATRNYLAGYNQMLRSGGKTCSLKQSMFSLQAKYVLQAGENRTADINRFRARRESGVSVKSREPVKIEKARGSVSPLPADFYDEIRAKINKLFDKGERLTELEARMPDTKWVRIPYEKSGYYVVGLIGSRPDFIAYGLPGKFSAEAPEELGESARWWPWDVNDPESDGLWLLYQDARTGDSVENPV